MISVAIVEDDDSAAKLLEDNLRVFESSSGQKLMVKRFEDAVTFLSEYRSVYDVVFMDIEMPNLNGMDAAYKMRKFDKNVVLIFVTNMAQFAVKGYEVDALNFMIKPIGYQDFCSKMKKAIQLVKANAGVEVVISQSSGFVRLSTNDILFIEVTGHKLNYHTENETFIANGSLSDMDKKLNGSNFMRCSNCYLINPRHIKSVQKLTITMSDGSELQISHPKKKKFMTELADWLGEGNII